MSEKSKAELLKEKLFKKNENGILRVSDEVLQEADIYCEGYKRFLDLAKTEREAVKASLDIAISKGFTESE